MVITHQVTKGKEAIDLMVHIFKTIITSTTGVTRERCTVTPMVAIELQLYSHIYRGHQVLKTHFHEVPGRDLVDTLDVTYHSDHIIIITTGTKPFQLQWTRTQGFGRNPNMSNYDGKVPWRAYEVKLAHMARQYNWTNHQKLDKLVEAL